MGDSLRATARLEQFRLKGLVAATFTPFKANGSLDLKRIKPVVDAVIGQGATGLYVCGSTGEGPLLTGEERMAVARATVEAASSRVPVVIQVGHNSIREARQFAAHAESIGADAISASPPTYFRPETLGDFIRCIAHIAGGAPRLPFYYYNIPSLSGVNFDMVEFLRLGTARIPTLRGIKFSDPALHELQACIQSDGGRYDILFGVDEMMLGALVFGARGAVGSTYNFAAPLYLQIISAFERGDIGEARRLQSLAAEMVRTILSIAGRGGLKATMALIGADCGSSRLPTVTPGAAQRRRLRAELSALGFFEWLGNGTSPRRFRTRSSKQHALISLADA